MARPRDYKAEYARRLERARALGLTREQARGHPRPGEPGLAELRQMRRAASVASPGQQRGFGVRRPVTSALRQRTLERVAELAGVLRPEDGRDRTRRLSAADRFVDEFMRLGLGTAQQAYTLWFSP